MKSRIISLIIVFCIGLCTTSLIAQEEPEVDQEALKASQNLTWEANEDLSNNKFVDAEVDYRKAISKSKANAVAPYNLGNAYYANESYSEAFGRFKEAGELASEKPSKHRAYHNMGNVFMKNKEYAKAVEAYKEALRNNPEDEETRYNLALAKEMLKKDQQNQQQNEDDKENDKQDQDQKEDQNQGNQEQDNPQDKGEEGEDEDQQKDQNKKGDGEDQKDKDRQPSDGKEPQDKKPRPNQLSPQQIENLLEAMENEEKKVQEKMEAKKVKGVKKKTEKDW
ncbi:MAG: tetratricopeptide repeat protein [Flavobacteriaceae bacterium]